MTVEIYAPHKTLFSGKAISVTLPGSMGKFAILDNHAPLISVLEKGNIRITRPNQEDTSLDIISGFVEVNNNLVKICVEIK
jgi:F-type H+-transporting ATPase subunit epsilon